MRGAFWVVAGTVTASVLIEHAAIHATAHTAEPLLGAPVLGLVGAAVVTMIVTPPAAFTISIVYERLQRAAVEDERGGQRPSPPASRLPVEVRHSGAA